MGSRPTLSEQEKEILRLVLHGKSIKQISRTLDHHANTITNRIRKARQRMGLPSVHMGVVAEEAKRRGLL